MPPLVNHDVNNSGLSDKRHLPAVLLAYVALLLFPWRLVLEDTDSYLSLELSILCFAGTCVAVYAALDAGRIARGILAAVVVFAYFIDPYWAGATVAFSMSVLRLSAVAHRSPTRCSMSCALFCFSKQLKQHSAVMHYGATLSVAVTLPRVYIHAATLDGME